MHVDYTIVIAVNVFLHMAPVSSIDKGKILHLMILLSYFSPGTEIPKHHWKRLGSSNLTYENVQGEI